MGNGKSVIEKESDHDNISHIINAVKSADIVIYAAGTGHMNNKAFRRRQNDLLERLTPYEHKLMCIADARSKRFYHPLCPIVRTWNLMPFALSELADITDEYVTSSGTKVVDTDLPLDSEVA